MSTIAPAKAAQLLLRLFTVILIVNGTPMRSLVIVLVTSDEGDLVGKGPAVSEGVAVQASDVDPVVSLDVELLPDVKVSSLLQECANGAMVARPKTARLFFRKSFRSMIVFFALW